MSIFFHVQPSFYDFFIFVQLLDTIENLKLKFSLILHCSNYIFKKRSINVLLSTQNIKTLAAFLLLNFRNNTRQI